MSRSKYRLLLIFVALSIILVPLVLRGATQGLNKVLNISTLDQIAASVMSGLIAAYILDHFLQNSLIRLEERIVNTLLAIRELGIETIARRTRGTPSSTGRSRVPADIIRSSRGEIIILAVSGRDTIVGMKDVIRTQLTQFDNLRLACILMSPNSDHLHRVHIKPVEQLKDDINESILTLRELNSKFRGRVRLKTLRELPTFTSTAINTQILSDISGDGLIGFQPWLDGDIHHGLIIEVGKMDGGLWPTFVKALEYYWHNSDDYDLCDNDARYCEPSALPRMRRTRSTG